MSGRKFMEAMGEVEDKYIEEALQYVPAKSVVRGTWMKWCVTAACLALIVCAGIFATRSGKETPFELDPSLPMLRIESGEGGMGYSAVMYYDISEDSDLNPWNEEVVLETLPVLTGGGYLHIAKSDKYGFSKKAVNATSIFGSTSPSYLILQSLDLCNRYIDEKICDDIEKCAEKVAELTKEQPVTVKGYCSDVGEFLGYSIQVESVE